MDASKPHMDPANRRGYRYGPRRGHLGSVLLHFVYMVTKIETPCHMFINFHMGRTEVINRRDLKLEVSLPNKENSVQIHMTPSCTVDHGHQEQPPGYNNWLRR